MKAERLCVVLLAVALSWVPTAATASSVELIEQASSWYAENCSDPEKDLHPSDEATQLLGQLHASDVLAGEPELLAWHGLISICTGDREGGEVSLKLFKTIAGELKPALMTRIDLEIGLRDGQCDAATEAASKLAAESKEAEDWHAVLLARTHCKASCTEIVGTAVQLRGFGGDDSDFKGSVDTCRTVVAEGRRRAEEEEQRLAEERQHLGEKRAVQRAELNSKFEALGVEYGLAKRKGHPVKAVGAIGLGSGGVLVAIGGHSRVQAGGFSQAAAETHSELEYEEQVGLTREANARFVGFFGSGAALVTAGVIGVIVSAAQDKKNKELRNRYEALRRELDDLEEEDRR